MVLGSEGSTQGLPPPLVHPAKCDLGVHTRARLASFLKLQTRKNGGAGFYIMGVIKQPFTVGLLSGPHLNESIEPAPVKHCLPVLGPPQTDGGDTAHRHHKIRPGQTLALRLEGQRSSSDVTDPEEEEKKPRLKPPSSPHRERSPARHTRQMMQDKRAAASGLCAHDEELRLRSEASPAHGEIALKTGKARLISEESGDIKRCRQTLGVTVTKKTSIYTFQATYEYQSESPGPKPAAQWKPPGELLLGVAVSVWGLRAERMRPLVRGHLQGSRQDGSHAGEHQAKLLGLLSANPLRNACSHAASELPRALAALLGDSVSACARRTDRSPGQAGVSGTSGVKWPAEDTVHHACVLYSSAEQEEAPSNLRRCGRQHPGCAAAHNTAGIQKKTTEGKCLITGQTIMI
ncbi:unnamed protein product [Tetraodon nigroviridis]|uniref:(spotted green pufferfish) hypothetical protein n=1 Tax=Tetraodon nigroviridis TaxID=99883 RepID=Q4SJF9_TETNG|nr:unnamed protein product [Tetraodon nigroviridis]